MPIDDRTFASRIRQDMADDTELRQSLKTFGWAPEFPAICDENDAILVGNRRMRIAKEEDIKPVIKRIEFGPGSDADAKRIRLALISNLGGQPLSKNDRRRIAEHLYGTKEWTMERIGKALGVSTRQISKDLGGFEPSSKPLRPKGGRPKKPKAAAERQEKIVALSDAGVARDQIARKVGVGRRQVDRVMEVENARREGPPPVIDTRTLPKSAREKLDAAIRAHRKKLDQEFELRVLDECEKRLDELSLPAYAKELEDAQQLLRSRHKGIMPRSVFQLIRSCLHPDARNSVSDKRLHEAFHEFSTRERLMLSEADNPTPTLKFPRTWAEAQEWKRKVKEQRKAKK